MKLSGLTSWSTALNEESGAIDTLAAGSIPVMAESCASIGACGATL
jgi:hypothetical protein